MQVLNQVIDVFGIVMLVVIVVSTTMLLFHSIVSFIEWLILKYQIKHRFDKPPLAKCYCIDCKVARFPDCNGQRYCPYMGRYVADDWFCHQAEQKNN